MAEEQLIIREEKKTLRKQIYFPLILILITLFRLLLGWIHHENFENLDFYFVAVFVLTTSYLGLVVYQSFRSHILAVLSDAGVWIKEHGDISWNEISSFYTEVSPFGAESFTYFYFLTNDQRELRINLTVADTDLERVQSFVKRHLVH